MMKSCLVALACILCSWPITARAQNAPVPADWPREKCDRYQRVTNEALRRFGREGLGLAFLENHEAFLVEGCTSERKVCPQTPEELRLANALVIQGMNAGLPSTFFPFACRKT